MSNKHLLKAIMCSEIMLKDAEAGNWDNVANIEAQRSELLEKLFSGAHQGNNVDDMDNKIRKIIAINEKLEAITLKARDSTGEEIASMSKGRKAVNLYAQNTV